MRTRTRLDWSCHREAQNAYVPCSFRTQLSIPSECVEFFRLVAHLIRAHRLAFRMLRVGDPANSASKRAAVAGSMAGEPSGVSPTFTQVAVEFDGQLGEEPTDPEGKRTWTR